MSLNRLFVFLTLVIQTFHGVPAAFCLVGETFTPAVL